jgi:putative transposase
MEYSYKFRIYPSEEQKDLIAKTFRCCRYVFNYFFR